MKTKNLLISLVITPMVLMTSGAFAQIPSLPNVTSPSIDKLELVASDGGGTYGWNAWGGHQSKITHHADGSVRLIYNILNTSGGDSWRVMKKQGETGSWALEASGNKFDDFYLLRDAVTDKAHVITSPNSVRTISSSPSFSPVVIPGTWEYKANTSRQYGGAGIGADGTVCFKNFREVPSSVLSSTTNAEYICGKMNSAGVWTWNSQVIRNIGPRYAYDYIFPGAQSGFNGFLAVSQRDLYKDAAGYPNLSGFAYVFDGVRFYKTGYASDANWFQKEIVSPLTPSSTATVAPQQIQRDAYIDSQNRVISNYFVSNPNNSSSNGFYVTVSDMNGNILLNKKWNLPAYGFMRVFEGSDNRLWLLWYNNGSAQLQMYLYPITVTSSPFNMSISTYTDFSSTFAPHRMTGGQNTVYLTRPAGGNQKNNFIDGMLTACGTDYPSSCSGNDRIYYFRIRIPVTSSNVAVTGVSVSPTSSNLTISATQQLTATVSPSNATNKTVTWGSSNTSVATVNASGLVTAVATGTATITVTTQDGGKTATSVITVSPTPSFCNSTLTPIIDGVAESTWTQIKTDTLKNIISGTITSSADLSTTYKAIWDNTALYLLVRVKDDVLKNDSGINTWDDDALEIFVDGNNNKTTSYDANDHQYILRWNDATVYEYGTINTQNPAGVTFSQGVYAGGYLMEIKITWSAIGVTPASGKLIGLDILNDDDDDGGAADASMSWFTQTTSSSSDPSTFGTIKLDNTSCGNVTTGIVNGELGKSILIYPNPFNANFTLKISDKTILKNAAMKIYDICGKEVKTISISSNETIIDRGELQSGIYFYSIFYNNERIDKGKLIVQ